LERVRETALKNKKMKFTALLHHLDEDSLLRAFQRLEPKALPGVDGVVCQRYRKNVTANLKELCSRIHHGSYRAKPCRRVYIPKADGRLRPLGIATLEDKIVQGAVVEILNSIYETDFLGFSYGFRHRRGAHQALDALAVGIARQKVNWVLDADIRGFFDNISHEWMVKYPSASDHGSAPVGADLHVALGWSHRARPMEIGRGGHSAGRDDLAPIGQPLIALCFGYVGSPLAPPLCPGRGSSRAVC